VTCGLTRRASALKTGRRSGRHPPLLGPSGHGGVGAQRVGNKSSRTSAWTRAAQIQTLPRRVLSSGRRPCGRDRLANGYRGDRSVSVGPAQQPHLAARTHRCAERTELSWSRLTVLRVRQPHRRRCDQRPASGRPKRNFRSSRRGRDSCVDAPESSQLVRGEGDEQDKPG